MGLFPEKRVWHNVKCVIIILQYCLRMKKINYLTNLSRKYISYTHLVFKMVIADITCPIDICFANETYLLCFYIQNLQNRIVFMKMLTP
jgi:hypothetical protein